MSPQPTVTRARRPKRRLPKLPDHNQLGPAPARRLAFVGSVAVLLQMMFFDRLTLFGMTLDLPILTVVLVAMLAGPIEAAMLGFGIGLAQDLFAGQTLGVDSLVLATTGYAIGTLSTIRDPDSNVAAVAIAVLGTLLALFLEGFLALWLDSNFRVTAGIAGEWLGTMLLSAILAIPLMVRLRSILLPMLPEETRRRRRRRTPGERAIRSPELR